eukprot:scaffold241238_cov24-Tisochrysis_lutea.AAC.1
MANGPSFKNRKSDFPPKVGLPPLCRAVRTTEDERLRDGGRLSLSERLPPAHLPFGNSLPTIRQQGSGVIQSLSSTKSSRMNCPSKCHARARQQSRPQLTLSLAWVNTSPTNRLWFLAPSPVRVAFEFLIPMLHRLAVVSVQAGVQRLAGVARAPGRLERLRSAHSPMASVGSPQAQTRHCTLPPQSLPALERLSHPEWRLRLARPQTTKNLPLVCPSCPAWDWWREMQPYKKGCEGSPQDAGWAAVASDHAQDGRRSPASKERCSDLLVCDAFRVVVRTEILVAYRMRASRSPSKSVTGGTGGGGGDKQTHLDEGAVLERHVAELSGEVHSYEGICAQASRPGPKWRVLQPAEWVEYREHPSLFPRAGAYSEYPS